MGKTNPWVGINTKAIRNQLDGQSKDNAVSHLSRQGMFLGSSMYLIIRSIAQT